MNNMASLKKITAVLVIVAVCMVTSQNQDDTRQWNARKAVSRSNLDFSKDLFKVISKKSGNLFFSPTSIHVILAMTSLGARGDTAHQMVQGLHLPQDQQTVKDGFRHFLSSLHSRYYDIYLIKIANRIFTDTRLTPRKEFLEAARNDFKSDSVTVNFQQKYEEARVHINSWVMEQTENKIKDLLPAGSLDSSTKAVLVNALYFKGSWANEFRKESTNPLPFYVRPGLTVDVPMMYQFASSGLSYTNSQRLNAEILQMGYMGGDVSMLIILPKQRYGLEDVERKLSQMNYSELMARETSWPSVHLYLPKFKMEYQENLVTVLAELGMSKMFTPAADFRGVLSNNQTFKITNVFHNAFIAVNENGTEAAAATGGPGAPTSAFFGPPPPEIIFKADHPFLFLLVNSKFRPANQEIDHTILFMGRCAQPNA